MAQCSPIIAQKSPEEPKREKTARKLRQSLANFTISCYFCYYQPICANFALFAYSHSNIWPYTNFPLATTTILLTKENKIITKNWKFEDSSYGSSCKFSNKTIRYLLSFCRWLTNKINVCCDYALCDKFGKQQQQQNLFILTKQLLLLHFLSNIHITGQTALTSCKMERK